MAVMENNRLTGEIQRPYEVEGQVRDSELDLAGVVNHMHYLIYMANARSRQLRELGLDTPDPTKVDIQFKRPLFAGDEYCVTSKISIFNQRQVRFEHTIERLPDRVLAAKATVETRFADQDNRSAEPLPLTALARGN